MNFIDFDDLLDRMATLEQAAFTEFEDATHALVSTWLHDFGLPEATVNQTMPSCLLALGVVAAQRRAEIERGRVLIWLRVQTRSLVLRYWREADEQSSPPPKLTAHRARREASKLDGGTRRYARAARKLNVPPGWLRRRHRRLLARSVTER